VSGLSRVPNPAPKINAVLIILDDTLMLSPLRLSAEKSLLIVFRLAFYRQKPQDIFYNLIAVDGKK
jgi:hypothetical protein